LAIQASGIISDIKDFGKALFGKHYEAYDSNLLLVERGFKADGLFMKGEGEPTFAGILAFITVGFTSCSAPVIYHHPRFTNSLPSDST